MMLLHASMSLNDGYHHRREGEDKNRTAQGMLIKQPHDSCSVGHYYKITLSVDILSPNLYLKNNLQTFPTG